jgi:hypothetical protein
MDMAALGHRKVGTMSRMSHHVPPPRAECKPGSRNGNFRRGDWTTEAIEQSQWLRSFVGASLQQLIAAARLPNSGICEIAVNASLAFIEGAKPLTSVLTGAGGAGRAPPCTTPYIEPAWFGAGSVSPVFGKHRRNSSTTVQFGPCPHRSWNSVIRRHCKVNRKLQAK